MQINKKIKLSSAQIITLSFFILIVLGAFLLTLPISSASGSRTNPLDALLTATSAACVTGLIVFDTATHWSLFGHLIILILIQIGGLGVITVATLIVSMTGRKIGLFERRTIQDSISADNVGGIVKMTRFIFKGVIIVELLGACLLSIVFIPEFGPVRGIWYSIFHSISAFCNAGFDLMGVKSPYSSLTDYRGNVVISIIIPLLILIGGLGFATWKDIADNKFKISKYSIQSKAILSASALLIVFPVLFFYFYEFTGEQWLGLSDKERLLASFFQTVTPRTAGFNTVDLTLMSEPGIFVVLILMLIGGASGSTAGGMKIGTVVVMFAVMFSIFSRKSDVNILKRRLPDETIRKACTVFIMYISLFLGGSLAISMLEGLPLLTCMFEAASAVATVGLTLGITPTLSAVSKIILILLMFCGRVGGLTIIFAAGNTLNNTTIKYPETKITVG